jgi:hypothetical protein
LDHTCAALECKPGNLLEYVAEDEDSAITVFVKAKDGYDPLKPQIAWRRFENYLRVIIAGAVVESFNAMA